MFTFLLLKSSFVHLLCIFFKIFLLFLFNHSKYFSFRVSYPYIATNLLNQNNINVYKRNKCVRFVINKLIYYACFI